MRLGAPQAEVYRLGAGDWWAAAISVPPTAAALDWVLSDAAQRVWDNNGMQARAASAFAGVPSVQGGYLSRAAAYALALPQERCAVHAL